MKKRLILKIICLLFSALFFSFPVCAQKDYDIDECINDILLLKKQNAGSLSTDGYILNSKVMANIFSEEDSGLVIALSRCGYSDNTEAYGKVLLGYLKDKYSQTQKLSELNTSAGAKIALTLLACGYNPLYIEAKNAKVYNFLADTIYQRDSAFSLGKDGTEAYAWGLIAIDAFDYGMTDDIWDIRDSLISQIVQNQNEDGTFSSPNKESPYYLTALVLTAVGKYYQNTQRKEAEIQKRIEQRNEKDKKRLEEGKKATFEEFEKQYEAEQEPTLYDMLDEAIEKSVEALSNAQDENGAYKSEYENNVTVTSAVITALCSMGYDPLTQENFIKGENTLLDGLMKMKNGDGSFCSNENADVNKDTVSALSALASYRRLKNGQTSFYDFSDTDLRVKTDMTAVSKKDEENLTAIGRKLDLDDYPYLHILRNKFEGSASPKARYYVSYIDYLLSRLAKQQKTVDYINTRGNKILLSQRGLSLSGQKQLQSLVKMCELLPEADKSRITVYDGLKELSEKTNSSVTADIVVQALSLTVILSVFLMFLMAYIKKKTMKKIKLNFSESLRDFPLKNKNQPYNDLRLPFEENEEFFEYDETDNDFFGETDTEKMLPFEKDEDFFEYNTQDAEEAENDDSFNLPFENDESFFMYNYEENEENEEKNE